jgi:hypothetical protein
MCIKGSPKREGEYKAGSQELSPSLLGKGLGRGILLNNLSLVFIFNGWTISRKRP